LLDQREPSRFLDNMQRRWQWRQPQRESMKRPNQQLLRLRPEELMQSLTQLASRPSSKRHRQDVFRCHLRSAQQLDNPGTQRPRLSRAWTGGDQLRTIDTRRHLSLRRR
jgi:hypothetical protein